MKKHLTQLTKLPGLGFVLKKFINFRVESEATEIAKHFISYLKPQIAQTEELRTKVFQIRHNVYCDELQFENVKESGLESDLFDAYSSFCMVQHKPTQEYAGCVRLVETQTDDQLLPIEAFCGHAIENSSIHPKNFNRHTICEISRLAVISRFRRRSADKFEGAATGAINEQTYSELELRCFPFIAIGLYMSAAALAIEHGRKHVFVMMEPRLARSMSFLGIKFQQLGPPIDYHGLRAPYYITPEIFYANLKPGFKSLYNAIDDDIARQK